MEKFVIINARNLSKSEPKIRYAALKKLQKWFASHKSLFSQDDMMKLWTGLYYCMWLTDKPLIQEEVAEKLSALIIQFNNEENCFMFVKCFFKTLSREWYGIDKFRMDKFLMLVRRFYRHLLIYAKSGSWKEITIKKIVTILKCTVFVADSPFGLKFHITDIYCEELAKVIDSDLTSTKILYFIELFCDLFVSETDSGLLAVIENKVFNYLMRQSDIGIKHECWYASKHLLYCGENFEDITDDDIDDYIDPEFENEPLVKDPRAGRINVELPQLKIDYKALADKIEEIALNKKIRENSKKWKKINYYVNAFINLNNGKYPLAINFPESGSELDESDVDQALERLVTFENKLLEHGKHREKSNKEKVRLKKKKKSKSKT